MSGRLLCTWQVLQREKEVADLEAMHLGVTGRLEQRLAHVEARLAKQIERCRQLEHRCAHNIGTDFLTSLMPSRESCLHVLRPPSCAPYRMSWQFLYKMYFDHR